VKSDGFYVNVGAGDPVEMSVTKWFHDLGWSGIIVEPNPRFWQQPLIAPALGLFNADSACTVGS
jgi:hypothetical protein